MTSTTALGSPRAGELWPPPMQSGNGAGPRRRRRWLLVLALILIAGGAVANTLLWVGQGERIPVLAVARPLTWMQQITEADVVVVGLSTDPGVAVVAASQRGQVIGKRATGNLTPGTLLSAGLVTDATLPGAKQQLVSVPLRPGVVPARGLRPGDAVLVVVGGGAAPAGTNGDRVNAGGVAPVAGRVAQVGAPAADGSVTVDVAVSEAAGPALAAALVSAGAERSAALVLLPPGS